MRPDPACAPLAVSVETARAEAHRLEMDNPLWIVVFGVYSKEFVGFPRFTSPGGAIVVARQPDELPPQMRHVEDAARVYLRRAGAWS